MPAAQTVQVNGVIRGSRSLSTEEIGIVLVNLWHDAGCSSTYVFFVVYDEDQATSEGCWSTGCGRLMVQIFVCQKQPPSYVGKSFCCCSVKASAAQHLRCPRLHRSSAHWSRGSVLPVVIQTRPVFQMSRKIFLPTFPDFVLDDENN